ncbi:hypothetical protein SAMN05519103_08785 [Rhizobiales bacterium GAS113]|nr:hypothetical protein SAMN05519103_08785 [Rhizobiales bacterium GAS113]
MANSNPTVIDPLDIVTTKRLIMEVREIALENVLGNVRAILEEPVTSEALTPSRLVPMIEGISNFKAALVRLLAQDDPFVEDMAEELKPLVDKCDKLEWQHKRLMALGANATKAEWEEEERIFNATLLAPDIPKTFQ